MNEQTLHKKTQELRETYRIYFIKLGIQNNKHKTLINNKFVDILILNELFHKENKP